MILLIITSWDNLIFPDKQLIYCQRYRKFELTISDVKLPESISKHCEFKKLYSCKLKHHIKVLDRWNNRTLKIIEDYDEKDGLYFFHALFWDFKSRPNTVFDYNVDLAIIIDISNNGGKIYTNLYTIYLPDYINIPANTDMIHKLLVDEKESLQIYMRYECYGYSGINCHNECEESGQTYRCEDSNMTDYTPSCKGDFCSTKTNYPCKNRGICRELENNEKFCKCRSGYGGLYCEDFQCDEPCDSDYGKCIGPNKCQCLEDYKFGPKCDITVCTKTVCENEGECTIIKNDIFCQCNRSIFAGRYCQYECPSVCVYGECVNYEDVAYCDCYNGYYGPNCSSASWYSEDLAKYKCLSNGYYVGFVLFSSILILMITVILVHTRWEKKKPKDIVIEYENLEDKHKYEDVDNYYDIYKNKSIYSVYM